MAPQGLNSTNGTKVNGQLVQQKALRPGDEITIAKRRYLIQYTLPAGHRAFSDFLEQEDIGQSLLEKAGLEQPKRPPPPRKPQFEPVDEDDDGDTDLV